MCAAAAVLAAALVACSAGDYVEVAEDTMSVATEETATAVSAAETTAESTTEQVTEDTSETEEEIPQDAVETEGYVQVSEGNEFIDFEYIEDYQGTADIGDLADKAVEFLKNSEYYTESMENIEQYSFERAAEMWSDEEIAKEKSEEFASYIKDGKIEPKLKIAYPADYDGDGSEETFIVVDMPCHVGSVEVVRDFLIFADSNGEMEILQDYSGMYPVLLINYGGIKQLTFGGSGIAGADDRNILYGVKGGKAVEHYAQRGGFYKSDCFLSTFGWQGMGDFMYFDTAEQEYRVIDGVDIDVEDVRAMDTANDLAEVWADSSENFLHIELIGGKYYCMIRGMMDEGAIYTYENGRFTHLEDSNVRISMNFCDLKEVVDIDIERALANMKPPTEPYVKVFNDNEFIDYNFIANYPGTKDIGGLADKAVEFLMTTEEYADSMKKADTFTEKSIRRRYAGYDYDDEETREKDIKGAVKLYSEYLDEKGNILPKFKIAYPNDYDGDGREEVFIVVDMPVEYGSSRDIESFLIFSGSGGEMQLIDYFSNAYPTVLLDYGICRHIAIGGSGLVGAADHTVLYGVRSDKAEVLYSGRCSFYKEDCFLAAYGWQGSGGYMYYDTSMQKYLAVGCVSIPMEDIKKMDKDNVLAEYYDWFEEYGFVYFDLIGGKYYCASLSPMDTGTIYTYENGRFVLRNDSYARCSEDYRGSTAVGLDIDKAVSQMKPVAEPFSPITKGSTPIDFGYIENYQSASDLDQYKELIGEFVNEAYAYSSSKYCTDEMTDEKFAGYTDSDGNLIPKILAAYPNDYDGDGREETFAVFEIPCKVYDDDGGKLVLGSFVVLIDSSGEINRHDYYYCYPADTDGGAVLLDYGEKKHILFIDSKENTVYLYGVSGSRAEEYFSGEKCTVKKNGCSLDISHAENGGCVLYYDNAADDYLTLSGRNFHSGSSMPSPIKVPNG